jgi:UDP-glucose 4-epimerase
VRVVVTEGAGFIGSRTVDMLIETMKNLYWSGETELHTGLQEIIDLFQSKNLLKHV